jgi:DNA-binding LacI/PurR family transcriptional regulator
VIFADIIENRTQVEAAVDTATPCVVINNIVEDLDVNYIAVDNHLGGKLAAEYLVSLGHTKVATITGNLNTQSGSHRYEGFKEYLDKKRVPLPDHYVYKGDYSRRAARIAVEQFMTLPQPPTAIFAASDDMALEIVAYALEKGLKVPGDLSVVGFDDNVACLYGSVALTTIHQPLMEKLKQEEKSSCRPSSLCVIPVVLPKNNYSCKPSPALKLP